MTYTVQVKIMDTTPFKRFMYERCMPIGEKIADLRFAKKPVPAHWRLLYRLADLALFRALKDRLGMSNLRTASTGGAALGPDVFRFFHGMGVPLKQIYGQTEIAGISCIHRDDDIAFHSVGKPIPGTEVRIAPDGEILSRSASVFLGYYKNEEATRSRKVRRVFVGERYRDVIAALYGAVPEVRIDTTIKFQDGKTAHIRTTLLVRRLELGRAAYAMELFFQLVLNCLVIG